MRGRFDLETFNFVNKESEHWFDKTIRKRVHSIYRCNQTDKLIYVTAMRRVNSCVAYIGDSVSDVIPIKAANIGFAMKASDCSML